MNSEEYFLIFAPNRKTLYKHVTVYRGRNSVVDSKVTGARVALVEQQLNCIDITLYIT